MSPTGFLVVGVYLDECTSYVEEVDAPNADSAFRAVAVGSDEPLSLVCAVDLASGEVTHPSCDSFALVAVEDYP